MDYAFPWLNAETPSKLAAGLEKLTGNDYEQAERMETAAGNVNPSLVFSKGFQARLAAIALGVPAPEFKSLPIREYNRLTLQVFNFLFGSSEEESESGGSTERLQSAAPSTEVQSIGSSKRPDNSSNGSKK